MNPETQRPALPVVSCHGGKLYVSDPSIPPGDCAICGEDHEGEVPWGCYTGDGD